MTSSKSAIARLKRVHSEDAVGFAACNIGGDANGEDGCNVALDSPCFLST